MVPPSPELFATDSHALGNIGDWGVNAGGVGDVDAEGAGGANAVAAGGACEADVGWEQCHPFVGCTCSGGALC
jgi:hypothetical protein